MKKKAATKKKARNSVKATKKALGIKARSLHEMLIRGPYLGLTEAEARCQLHQKILELSHDLPEVKTTGSVQVREGEEFCFTIYSDVRKEVDPLLHKYKLTFTPYSDPQHKTEVKYEHGWHYVTTHYALMDAETGYREIIPGFGVGQNRWWAADSAGTLALKHALLQTLHINWDNRPAWDVMIREAEASVPMTVKAVMDELATFPWFRKHTESQEQAKEQQRKKTTNENRTKSTNSRV